MKELHFILSILVAQLAFSSYCYAQDNKNNAEELSSVLNIYNWEDYIAPAVLESFEKKFGVKVNIETYSDEEEMVARVQSNPGKYDLVIAANNLVRTMIELRLLDSVELKNIPNLENIDLRFLNLDYDPGNKYSIPYMWGTTGIVYNTKYVEGDVDGWGVLWEPKYKGKMSVLVNPYDVFPVGLKIMGYSLNSTDPVQLEFAGKKLMEQKPLLRGYEDFKTIKEDLVAEKLWIGQIYSSDAISACGKNKNLKYVIPKEGALLWVDNICIPRDCPHKHTAEVFINYILEPKVSADIANYLTSSNCNKAAREHTSKEILDNPALYPPEEMLKNCEFYEKISNPDELTQREKIINRVWSELQRSENK